MRKCLTVLCASLLLSSVAMAAPVTNLEKGQVNAGYLYWNPKADFASLDLGKAGATGAFVETALSDKVILGIETISGDASKTIGGIKVKIDVEFTDITMQYKVAENVRLIAGTRNYDDTAIVAGTSRNSSSSKFTYGVSASTDLKAATVGYASVLHNSYGTDWQFGVNQKLDDKLILNVNYRNYDEDNSSLKGIGAGLIYKF